MPTVQERLLDAVLKIMSEEKINPDLFLRNKKIKERFSELKQTGKPIGTIITQLADEFYLSEKTIEGIVY